MNVESRPTDAARCLTCGYPLRGLPGNRCPECGREFDPNDARTMNMGRVMGPWARRSLRPPGRLMAIAAVLAALGTLVSACAPGVYFPLLIFCYLAWMLIGVGWLVRLLVSLFIAWRFRQDTFRRRETWIRWAIAPGVVLVTLATLYLQIPLRLTFGLSQPAMNRLAEDVMRSPDADRNDRWIGLYYAKRIDAMKGGMRFVVYGTGFLDQTGFAYSPNGPPQSIGGDFYTRFSGPWYLWREDF